MVETISNFNHIFRSISHIRIFYSPVITCNSSFNTTVMEIFIKLLFTVNLGIVTFVVFVEEASVVTSWAQFCVMKRSMIVSYTFDVFWSISYRGIIRTIIINWIIAFNAFISIC